MALYGFGGTERFQVLEQIGAGGMGVVYAARDQETGAQVALKTLKRETPQALYRMKKEFRALRDLEHPNLCRLGDLMESDGEWFFTMELVDGTDFLRFVTGREGAAAHATASTVQAIGPSVPGQRVGEAPEPTAAASFDEAKLRSCFAQLGEALAALHDAGRVHRDIKPSNILVEDGGRLVLLDFGLVAEAEPTMQSVDAFAAGTAAYMAPEQAVSAPITPAADMYAAGVLLYECLTGRLPYSGTAMDMLLDKQRASPPPPRALVDGLPPDLDELCVDLLQLQPTARPSARRLLKRLGVVRAPVAAGTLTSGRLTQQTHVVGRDRELGQLRRALDKTTVGQLASVLLRGGSGMGKTTLVRCFSDVVRGEQQDALVLHGRCYEREAVPYKAFDGVVDSLSRELKKMPDGDVNAVLPRNASLLLQIFPVLGRIKAFANAPVRVVPHEPTEFRRRAFDALRELFARLADRRTLVVAIEDVQWADADSERLLEDLVEADDPPACLLLLSARAEDGRDPPMFEVMQREGAALELELGPLSERDAESLALSLLEEHAPALLASAPAVAREAGGHPLHIAEIARYVALQDTSSGAAVSLDHAVAARLRELPAPAMEFIRALSIAGEPVPADTLVELLDLERFAFDRQASLLRLSCLVKNTGTGATLELEPYHDRIRVVATRSLKEDERRALHERLALAIETSLGEERPAFLLRHLRAAGKVEKARQHAMRAAEQAERAMAFERAADFYRVVLDLPANEERIREVRLLLAEALANSGHASRAADEYRRAAEHASATVRLTCANRAAELLLKSGHIEPGLAVLDQVLAEVGETMPRSPRQALWSAMFARVRLRARGLSWTPKEEADN